MEPIAKSNLKASRTQLRITAGAAILFFGSFALMMYAISEKCTMAADFTTASIVLSSLGIAVILISTRIVENSIFKPIREVRDYINLLSKGQLETNKLNAPNKEIGEVVDAILKLSEGNKKTFDFAKEMGKGNFNVPYTSAGEHDLLGNAMLEMRKNMLAVAEDEKKRNWANEGMAKFGELLRIDTNDIQKFSDNILTQLIKYVDANQGAFYVYNDEIKGEEHLTMTACYAYGRKKYLESRVELGEGLIGQTVYEREYFLMTDVPEDYLNITSGLGHATPRCVIVLPLLFNDEILGAIEMASFNVFEPYQIEFLNKLCVSIASSISTVKVNIRTNKLLAESMHQSSELKEKDIILRQQLEEVRATQEEMEQKDFQKRQIEWKTNAILEGCVECIIAFNQQGTIEFFNKAAQELWNISREKAIGMSVTQLLPIEINQLANGCVAMPSQGIESREIKGKTEMTINDTKGEELSILCSITMAKVGGECFFTAFIQNITVDIF